MKLIILDRDGVINQDSDTFIKSPAEWEAIPGSIEAIGRLSKAGYRIVVATNQSGIARGLLDITALNAIHQKMHGALHAAGGVIDAIFFCPHKASDNCDCRKPRAGMLDSIARRYETKLKGVPSVGDSLRDLQAAYNAGCAPYLVLTGKGEQTLESGGLPPGTTVYPDLAAVVDKLLDSNGDASVEK